MKLCQENGLEEEDSEVALRDVRRCLGVPEDCGGAVRRCRHKRRERRLWRMDYHPTSPRNVSEDGYDSGWIA